MFFRSKLFTFLLSLFAYIGFFTLWSYNYRTVWYANAPEETLYFVQPKMDHYKMYGYLFAISFILFVIFGLIYVLMARVSRIINYILIADLIFSAYYFWNYSVTTKDMGSNGVGMFLSLVLFAISIYKLARRG